MAVLKSTEKKWEPCKRPRVAAIKFQALVIVWRDLCFQFFLVTFWSPGVWSLWQVFLWKGRKPDTAVGETRDEKEQVRMSVLLLKVLSGLSWVQGLYIRSQNPEGGLLAQFPVVWLSRPSTPGYIGQEERIVTGLKGFTVASKGRAEAKGWNRITKCSWCRQCCWLQWSRVNFAS